MTAALRPRLGLCPIGKFVFSHEDALRQKTLLRERLDAWGVDVVDLEDVLPDGIVRETAHVAPAVERFRAAEVDGLFLPHCNFGTEHAAGLIGRDVGAPVLLWGPRDEAPLEDGTRLRDSLCGLFASSKVLRTLGVPFSYIENVPVDHPVLRAGVERFLRAVAAARTLRRGARIGLLGQRIDFFWTTIVDESDLLRRFHIEVLPLDLLPFLEAVRRRVETEAARYAEEVGILRETMTIVGFGDDAPLARILAARDEMLALAETHGLDALAIQDFPSLPEALDAYAFFANSFVSDRLPLACESDVHGALSALLLHRAANAVAPDAQAEADPVFLADVTIRHPEDENGVLLWHAGAPLSMKREGARAEVGHHWILPSPLSGMPHFPLRGGEITVARFDGEGGRYRLALGEGESMEGPHTRNNYVWMRVDDWPRWERTLMEGPYIHHVAMSYGRYAGALAEMARFVPDLAIDRLSKEEA